MNIRKLVARFTYSCWLAFGGRRTASGFMLLSDSIIAQRKMISDLRSQNRQIENRLWELEDHTTEEYLERATHGVKEWCKQSEQFTDMKNGNA